MDQKYVYSKRHTKKQLLQFDCKSWEYGKIQGV